MLSSFKQGLLLDFEAPAFGEALLVILKLPSHGKAQVLGFMPGSRTVLAGTYCFGGVGFKGT